MDLNCGNEYGGHGTPLADSYDAGNITDSQIKQSAARVMQSLMLSGGMDGDGWQDQPYANIPATALGAPEHGAEALRAARQGIVMLDRGTTSSGNLLLPLDANRALRIVIIGPYAGLQMEMIGGIGYTGWPCANFSYDCIPSINGSIAKLSKLVNGSTPVMQ